MLKTVANSKEATRWSSHGNDKSGLVAASLGIRPLPVTVPGHLAERCGMGQVAGVTAR